MVAEGNEKLEQTKTPMKRASKAGRKTSMQLASQAKQSEETPATAAMHQQARHIHVGRIAMAQQHRMHMEQSGMAEYNRLQAQAGAATCRAAVELKWKEWWQPA